MKINLGALKKRGHVTHVVSDDAMNICKDQARKFLNDNGYKEYNSQVFNNIVVFMSAFKLKTLAKGLYFMGPLGVGKSFGMECLSMFCQIDFVAANDLTDAYATDTAGRNAFETLAYPCRLGNKNAPKDLIIDEVGREPIPVNYFGTRVNVLEKVLQERYRLWDRYGARTIITTNLNLEKLIPLYGNYIHDRVEQMCNIVAANGEDLRKPIQDNLNINVTPCTNHNPTAAIGFNGDESKRKYK